MSTPRALEWPPEDARALFDAVDDAVIASDDDGTIVYANAAGHRLLGWPTGGLVGTPVADVVPEGLHVWSEGTFDNFVDSSVAPLQSQAVSATLVGYDGRRVAVEIAISLHDIGEGRTVVLGVLRQQGDRSRVQRWGEIAQALLDSLIEEGGQAERFLLEQLARRLGWDVAILWTHEEGGGLGIRSSWSADDRPIDPRLTEAARGLDQSEFPAWVLTVGEPVWVADLAHDARVDGMAPAAAGLTCAFGFPVGIGQATGGVIELFCHDTRQPNPELPELLMALSGHIGGVLAALRRSEERQQLIRALEEARRSQAFLLHANRVLAAAPDYADLLQRLAQVAVPALADLCLIDVLEELETQPRTMVRRMAVRGADPELASVIEQLGAPAWHDEGGNPIIEAMRSGRSVRSDDRGDRLFAGLAVQDGQGEVADSLEITSYMAVPMIVDDRILGTVTLASTGSGRRVQERDLALAEELTNQVASVVDRARTHQRDQEIAHTLQRTLLPDHLPELPFASVAARYLPGTEYLEVGGDWYDVIRLDTSVAAFVVGDVGGHDMIATSIMGRMRSALAAFLLQHRQPGRALAELNRFAEATSCARDSPRC